MREQLPNLETLQDDGELFVFRTMRDKWGVTYFKLDANFWGAMHGGRLSDPKATRTAPTPQTPSA